MEVSVACDLILQADVKFNEYAAHVNLDVQYKTCCLQYKHGKQYIHHE